MSEIVGFRMRITADASAVIWAMKVLAFGIAEIERSGAWWEAVS